MSFNEFWKTQELILKALGVSQAENDRAYNIASSAWVACQEEMIRVLPEPNIDYPE